ncbi:SpaA isopeptide-forming pilin-related protein [Candidatus Enterococcus mansonii]|uniref:Gram-positive cocci surface proteins LPxTG domain-containing protein n=1 Tax=Candidatus Enterococcus mansonii TaxID=1834181 RepID=A0A2C9XFM7_9ENTE|nr:SpaA isopeptide-forming pilin-related protein [Enterococcus sp. 4G2_DIV0659]OTO02772.1 hypothetical protein A5880_003168 [Enterococcus sp. 4G2_DIV0659]
MKKKELHKKISKGVTYLSLMTLLSPIVLQGRQVFAESTSSSESTEESETPSSKETTTDTEKEGMTVGDLNIQLPTMESLSPETPVFSKDENGKMYQVGQTEDGRIIQSSAVTNPLLRGIGNVQGEIIRITIAGVLYEGIKITVDGKGALCIDQHLRAPFEPNVPYDNGSPYENNGALAILSYGAYGPLNPNPTDEEILLTEIALRNWLTGKLTPSEAVSNSHPYIADLIEKAKNGDFIIQSFEFNKHNLESTIVGNEQVSEVIKTSGSKENYVSIPVPQGVTLTNITTGQKVTNGNAKVYGGQSFKMSAPLSYNQKYNSGNLMAAFGKPAAIVFTPFDVGYQRLMQGKFDDPQEVAPISVNFFAREGQLQIGKQDQVTKQMVPNTTYTGTIGSDKVTFTTGADGWAPISEKYIDGTPYNLVETAVPAGYTLDQTPITGTIKAAETTKITQQNNHQKAVVTWEKEKEVFDAEETALKGTPVYKDIPLEGAEFTNKNNNDTTAPDQETVLTPAGEYLDTMVTDAEGKGKSVIPFVNGEQNEYVFDETNEPENYRQFEPVTFNVPYEVSTVDVATYDLGIFKNELKTGEIDFNKKSDLDLSSLLNITGAKIHVEGLSENTKDVNFTFTTSAETNKLKLKEGQYRFSEVEYPDGWTISPNQPHSMIVEVKDNTKSTINWENTKIPMKITTLFATVDGKKVIDPTKDNKLEDTVKATDAWINTPMTFYTEFVAVKYNNGVIINQRVVGTDETDKTFKEKNEEFKVPLDLKKDTLKEGEALVATHVAKDKDGNVIAEETDLYNKDQTVVTETAKVPETPKKIVTPSTPAKTGSLPSTGETIQSTIMMIGFTIAAAVAYLFVYKKAETDNVA